ncbi:MAG: tryptophan--tRNA ligase [Edaphobacter sp.]|uniref:tryptophan--tRNA ligase n=1 Tax=Edaphobacter sp. TaxID=1934404 RepID=UPI00239580B6|nr:tryptophan--tRNA ligase [Edaphobacter sp.]MDE1176642.1 tryptophan--tRNA ligase [Edaphobacter sp.]
MTEQMTTSSRPRVLSGMRPTGKLHLGNYMGALYNWVKLQHEYECYFFIADWHALTTDYADPSLLKQNIFEVALDFLSAGLDPDRCTIFVQSHVPQHTELHLLLSMITPVSWLERVPTYKDQQEQLREKDLATYGFLGYPLLQSADILVYQPNFVPVGQDQVSHVELTREVARRFNYLYSPKHVATVGDRTVTEPDPDKLLLPEPEVLLTPSPKLPGIDGRKMSKSYGNSILLSDTTGDVESKMLRMSNGGQRPTSDVPGDPDICPVGDMHRLFSEPHVLTHITQGCRTATIRCDECKIMAAASINLHLHPIRERRARLIEDPDRVWEILDEGSARASKRAEKTMQQIRAVTGLSRDRSGVRLHQPFQELDKSASRNLTAFKDWWDLDAPILTRNLRERWRTDLLPSGKVLKPDAEGVWITQKGQRILVAVAKQNGPGAAWEFSAKPKSYEMLVLLCWDENYYLRDFVVPQKLILGEWIAAKKNAGKSDIKFSVERSGDRYLLHLLNPPPIDITSTESEYSVIPG